VTPSNTRSTTRSVAVEATVYLAKNQHPEAR
jgi:hypothetical protein